MTELALLRLLQLVSPGLPIGMYSYSQGFETAVEDGLITNSSQASEWINGVIENCLVQVDIPLALRLYDAWINNNTEEVEILSATLLAYRETRELRDEDRQTGQALARLLAEMDCSIAKSWQRKTETTLATMFMLAAVSWKIPKQSALISYLWSWLENQVLCAVKLVPLGQVAGQQLLHDLAARLPELVEQGMQLDDHDIGGSVFGLALTSSRHEMQYCRLFRS